MTPSQQEQVAKINSILGPAKKEFIMPFGKYRGRKISNIPTEYLHWLKEKSSDDIIIDEFETELERRNEL